MIGTPFAVRLKVLIQKYLVGETTEHGKESTFVHMGSRGQMLLMGRRGQSLSRIVPSSDNEGLETGYC
jgi:hypothetical protein